MDDFRPESVVQQVEPLQEAARGAHPAGRSAQQDGRQREARRPARRRAGQHRAARGARPRSRRTRNDAVAPQVSPRWSPRWAAPAARPATLLDGIVAQSKVARSAAEHARAKDIISELVHEVLRRHRVVSDNLGATLDARIAEIDELLSEQLSEVMHHPDFQKLESSWTGLHYLCKHTSTGSGMKIQILNATKKELVKDFKTAIDFDQSALFKKVYEEEFGTFGGAPFGTLIGDFDISRQPEDMYFARADVARRRRGARALHLRRVARDVRPRRLHRARPAARPGQGVRHRRLRQVEVVPRVRGRALRRPDAAALPRPPALRPEGRHRRRGLQLRRGRRRHATTRSTSGSTPPTPSRRA